MSKQMDLEWCPETEKTLPGLEKAQEKDVLRKKLPLK